MCPKSIYSKDMVDKRNKYCRLISIKRDQEDGHPKSPRVGGGALDLISLAAPGTGTKA